MREPQWRSGESDWGLPQYGPAERLAEIKGQLCSAAWLMRSPWRYRRVLRELSRRELVGVALGSGTHPPSGWVGLDRHRSGDDVFPADIRDRLPLQTASVPQVLAEHVLEHLYLDELPAVVAEVRRVLAPGGVFRVVCPDAVFVARMILTPEHAEMKEARVRDAAMHRWLTGHDDQSATVNRLSHQWGQHKSLLTAGAVARLMRRSGFVDVVELSVERSAHLAVIPDVHPVRFPDDPPGINFAVEGRVQ